MDEESQKMRDELTQFKRELATMSTEKSQIEKSLNGIQNTFNDDIAQYQLEVQKKENMLTELQNKYNHQLQIHIKDSGVLNEVRQQCSLLQSDLKKTKVNNNDDNFYSPFFL